MILRWNTYRYKLKLRVEKSVAARARRYARQQGLSISAMVEAYLSSVAEPLRMTPRDTPILRSLRGSLRSGDVKQYRRYLTMKYR